MSESLAAVTSTLVKKRAPAELNAALLNSIQDYDDAAFDQALLEGADPFAINVIWKGEKEPSDQSPLHYAIDFEYPHAVEALVKKGADVLERNTRGVQAIVRAVITGHDKVVGAILGNVSSKALEQIRKEARFCGKTLLHIGILNFSNYGVCLRSDWDGSKESWNLMRDFYYRKEGLIVPEDDEIPSPNYSFNIELISALVKAFGPSIWHQRDSQNVTPLEIIQNPSKYRHRFTDWNGDKTIQCLTSAEDQSKNIEVFKITFVDRLGATPVVVNARVYFDEILSLYAQHIQDYTEYFKVYFQSTQQQSHEQLKTQLLNVRELAEAQMLDLKQQQERLETDQHTLSLQQQQMHAQHDRMYEKHAAKQALRDELDDIRKNAAEFAFYSAFHTKLPAELTGAEGVFSGRLVRDSYATLDTVASVAGGASSLVSMPIVSTALSVVSKGTQLVSDHREKGKNANIATNAEGKHEKIARLAGVALVKHYRNHLAALNPDKAKKLGELAVDVAREALTKKGEIQPGTEESIASQLVEFIKKSPKFTKLLPIPVDLKQKDELERTVSPGRPVSLEHKESKSKESPERKGVVGGQVPPIVHSKPPTLPALPPRVVVTPSAPPAAANGSAPRR